MKALKNFAYDADDDEEIRLQKITILLVAGSCSFAGLVWAMMYYFIFGLGLTALLPLLFTIIVPTSLLVAHVTRKINYAVYTQIISIIYITAFIQWSIGDLIDSGLVLIWAFCGPIVALFFFPFRKSLPFFLQYLVVVIITVSFGDFFARHGLVVEEATRRLFFVMNLSFSSLIIFVFASHFVARATAEKRRADDLLLNTLPRSIVSVLKSGRKTIADHYQTSTVMFCDIVGSTPLFADMAPEDVVDWLNEVFSMFDKLVEKHGLEKIRTIGDNYMVAAGVPTPRPDHATAMADLALDMLDGLDQIPQRSGRKIAFRFGINSGPVVAGVIGTAKHQYDLWGDTVNVASRMEQHGETGKINISASTYALVKDAFDCEARGEIRIKGKQMMEAWFLLGPKTI